MQVVIIDPFLKNQSGHNFSYAIALQSELEKRGIPVIIIGNKSADEMCLKIKNFYPCLTDIVSEVFKMSFALKNICKIYELIKLLKRRLDDFFLNQSDFKIQKGNIFFIHSLYIFELLSFGLFLKEKAKIFIDNGHKIIIGFNFTYKRKSLAMTLVFALLYKYIFGFLIRDLQSQIIYFCDGEPLKKDYEKLLKKQVYILPLPVRNQYLEFYLNQPQKEINKNNIIISYVGGTRYNKGFDIFTKMLVRLLNDEEIAGRISFFIQVDTQRSQLVKDRKIVLETVRLLENLTIKFNKNIKLIYGSLSIEEYYKLLSESDIVALPYRKDFKRLPSSIFREAVVLGKIPIASNNTTMASELLKYNLNDLVFSIKDTEDFVYTIKKVINNIVDYKIKIGKLQKSWVDFYSAASLVDSIMSLAA